GIERLRLQARKLELNGRLDAAPQADMAAERGELDARYKVIEARLDGLLQAFDRDSLPARDATGNEIELSQGKVERAYPPNELSMLT
ncbi:phosphate ABC transporter, permease protein PstA, partial [Pseudomonas syringae pv. tagetis]